MPRCPACREPFSGSREEIGSRCPFCRAPLYEPPEGYRPRSRSDSFCSVHPHNPAVGTCQRCGNFQCDLCRTRWRSGTLCVACVNRALEANEVAPEETRASMAQGVLSLLLGLLGWLLLVFAFVAIFVAIVQGPDKVNLGLMVLVGLLLLASPVPSVLGVGLGAAALRARGSHMILATIGLILSGLHVGAFIGLFGFALWQS